MAKNFNFEFLNSSSIGKVAMEKFKIVGDQSAIGMQLVQAMQFIENCSQSRFADKPWSSSSLDKRDLK